MKKQYKQAAEKIFHYLGLALMFAMILVFILLVNPYRYFVYALLLVIAAFFLIKAYRQDWKGRGKAFIKLFCLVYIPLLFIFSVSPFLQLKEFQLTHPDWQPAEATITNCEVYWQNHYRRVSGYSYVNVSYKYAAEDKTYTATEEQAQRLYYPIWESKERIRKQKTALLQKANEHIKAKDFTTLYNTKAPGESKFFISRELFFPQGSNAYTFSILAGILLLLLILNVFFARKRRASTFKPKDNSYF